jgi:PadR family transcriptional regulator PadR
MSKVRNKGMRAGAVSLWLLLLLSERPMYGYELIRELEKRFSGYWKPQTGTIYPALDKLQSNKLVTSRREFREDGPDRKHYALTEKHKAIYRYKKDDADKGELGKLFVDLGRSFQNDTVEITKILPSKDKHRIKPINPIGFKFLYAKENNKLELHLDLQWISKK